MKRYSTFGLIDDFWRKNAARVNQNEFKKLIVESLFAIKVGEHGSHLFPVWLIVPFPCPSSIPFPFPKAEKKRVYS